MKNKKRLILFLITALLCINTMGTTVFAMETPQVTITATDEAIHIMTEETEWYYRYWYGVYQKRLWSITYGKWLTDWIDCAV